MREIDVKSADDKQPTVDRRPSWKRKRQRTTRLAEFVFYFLITVFLLMLAMILRSAVREAW